MRVFHLETMHFGEIRLCILWKYIKLLAPYGDQHLILVFEFLILDKSNISAFQKCYTESSQYSA